VQATLHLNWWLEAALMGVVFIPILFGTRLVSWRELRQLRPR
jgi:hypothetical protein